ncbi:MAG: choice-of-anchor B family protein [Bacteroidia bacterium]
MKLIVLLPALCMSLLVAQIPQLELVKEAQFPVITHPNGDLVGTSDVWAWMSPDGEEYVLAGVKDGLAIIRASDMEILFTVDGPRMNDYYYHRDIKTYGSYAYVSSEMRGIDEGIQVIDLSDLPNQVTLVKSLTDQTITSHNLTIDTASQRAYITGSTNEGVFIYDLFRPYDPLAIGYLPEISVHDVYARNDTLWVANGTDYSIWDMSDHTDPQLIVRIEDPDFGYCHNIWPSKNGRYFVTTEETAGKTVKIWQMDTNGGVGIESEFLAPNGLVHNAHIEGDSLYLAHYTSGVVVVDISAPWSPTAVAQYDTYLLNDTAAFHGCWGVYPHSPSGYIYASNFEGTVQKFRFPGTSSIEGGSGELPVLLFPNPGNSPAIGFSLKKAGNVSLRWMDAQGRSLESENEFLGAGSHRLTVEAEGWPSGSYLYVLETEEGVARGSWLKK